MTQSNEPSDLSDDEARAGPRSVGATEPDAHDALAAGQPASRVLLVLLRYAAPACAAIALVLVMVADVAELDTDLHLIAPSQLPRGARLLPLRALRYGHLLDAQGPQLVSEPVAVQVHVGGETYAGRIVSAPRELQGLEACLALPELRAGEWIEVITQGVSDAPALAVRAHVEVREQLDAVAPHGRALRALQQFAPGPIRAEPGAVAPAGLAVRVGGGACVPEQPCTLAVWVGAPQASLRVQPNSTLTPSPAAARGSAETSGVVSVEVTTHGPEAELWLIAERAGEPVARRAVRLPVAMGAVSAAVERRVVERSSAVRIHSPGVADSCIVDAFRDGHWRGTGSLRVCGQPGGLPFELGAGLWRLQLRRDAFSGDSAGVATVYVQQPGESAVQVAATWAHAAAQLDPQDAFVRSCSAQPSACVDAAALRYLAAVTETGLLSLPQPASAYAARVERAREQKRQMRWLALVALGLGALGLVLSVGRTGLSAGVRVSQLLAEDPGAARRARRRALLLSGASALSLLLVFAVLALYVLARGGY